MNTKDLLQKNQEWAQATLNEDAEFFDRLAKGQAPPFLWIGCSDSRVPANQVTGSNPGDIFVHRNIANMVVHSDMNLLSVIDYSVNVLKVKHAIVCGHYGCGGVNAAMTSNSYGIIDNWLRHIKDVHRIHADEIAGISGDKERWDRLVELNAIEQATNLSKTHIVQNAWKNGQDLTVHAWVFDLASGRIKDLGVSFGSGSDLSAPYAYQ